MVKLITLTDEVEERQMR